MKTLNSVYPDWAQLFTYMPTSDLTTTFDPSDLDIQFFSKYGERWISPFVEHFLEEDGTITQTNLERIASIVWHKYAASWLKKLAILSIEYNPIDNVDYTMTETTTHTGTDTLSKTGTEQDVLTKTGAETRTLTKDGTETETETDTGTETRTLEKSGTETDTKTGSISNSGTDNGNVFGFNTTEADGVPATKETTNNTQTFNSVQDSHGFANREDTETLEFNNRQKTTQQSFTNREDEETLAFNNRQDTNTKSFNSRLDTQTKNLTDEIERHMSGNYNVTTTQQMLQQEIELWNWSFLDDVFRDVASVVSISIYN